MSKELLVFGRPGCPMVYPVQALLKNEDIEYTYIDIYQDDEARERVRSINSGYESVPTIVFSDGSTLTEPSSAEFRKKLMEYGYVVESLKLVDKIRLLIHHPVVISIGIGLLVAGYVLQNSTIIIFGLFILAIFFLNRIAQGGG